MHTELPHSELLDQFEITAELLRSRLEKSWRRSRCNRPQVSTVEPRGRDSHSGLRSQVLGLTESLE